MLFGRNTFESYLSNINHVDPLGQQEPAHSVSLAPEINKVGQRLVSMLIRSGQTQRISGKSLKWLVP